MAIADTVREHIDRHQTPDSGRRDRRVRIIWALLIVNVLTFYSDVPHVLPIPSEIGRLIPQAALGIAGLLVLSVNRPIAVRPSVYVFLLFALVGVALFTIPYAEYVGGAAMRTGRLLAFVTVLWLLTPWWGRRDLLLVKSHLATVWMVLGLVIVGVAISPGAAMLDGRLGGAIWPMPPTQVAHYAAVATGLTVVLWLSGLIRREITLVAVMVSVPMLIATHTRTALIAMIAGLLIAGLSLFTTRARARKAFAAGVVVVSIGAITVSSLVTTWLARGQDPEQLSALTGRRAVWESIITEPRTTLEVLFGFGLSNKSYNGLPIDSNWLATYYDLGLVGAALSATIVAFLLISAVFRPRGPGRALALFLIVYCLVASFTETGLSDASPYLLELTLAASLLIAPAMRRGVS